uniref:Secreted protein n=1 Tax=Angiostrongylus cantonensis TaxID=6313 RepID=A0A0K0D7I5_ANGCA
RKRSICIISVFQFEVFTHEYRERKEIPNCGDHGDKESSCCSTSLSNNDKKRIINTSRKLQKAVYSLQWCVSSERLNFCRYFHLPFCNEVISEMVNKMKEIGDYLDKLM